jgi:hypothetical protein
MAGGNADRPMTAWDVLPAEARQCFACGADNPIGMHLDDIRREGDQVLATPPSPARVPELPRGPARRPVGDGVGRDECHVGADTPSVLGSSAVASVAQAAIAQVMTASRSARRAPSRACTDRPCTTVV